MKKTLLAFIFTLSLLRTIAQPQLTSAILPVAGDTILLGVDTVLRSPGAAGANITWDFTGLKKDFTSERIYLAPSATPYASTFPSATLARKDADGYFYTYWKNSATASVYYGFVQPGIVDQNYNTLPINYYKFPIQYGFSRTDNFSATTNPGSIAGAGKYYFNADGWGTLKLPGKSVSNTLRTKSVLYIGDSSINSYSLTTEYAWYGNTRKDALLVISTVVVNHVLTDKIILFDYSLKSDVKEIITTDDLKLYPNPAFEFLNLSIDPSLLNGLIEIKILDPLGKLNYQSTLQPGTDLFKIDISELSKGYYFLEIIAEDKVLHKQFLKG